mgnify:CR=1 FL=1
MSVNAKEGFLGKIEYDRYSNTIREGHEMEHTDYNATTVWTGCQSERKGTTTLPVGKS